MELYIFARFRVREGNEEAVLEQMRDVLLPTSGEPGCLAVKGFRSIDDPCLFYIHSHWENVAAFERHANLSHTRRFMDNIKPMVITSEVVRTAEQAA